MIYQKYYLLFFLINKRIADIYFSLLHEIAHLKSDFNKAKAQNIISYDEDIENKADALAYNYMVDDEYYDNVCKKYDYDIEKEKNILRVLLYID